ncbi:ABC_ATPase domain containing protein [uncultured Caudovirales phage]|uniref:ABC_ATPase domain containing protein n=1 Tax=uncultured Caudovirales phage TaxID=2100421 RepID=A0A6J5MC65_9CAUD|nr:ABC_ATPase domain containing protein [uncultured Caudovirales phage]CAB4189793.1 ABC_ATPase domain containing protein [uncultured Caudovirales phage]
MLNIRIRNFLGLDTVDLDIERIVLIGGLNGAGKSACLEAIAAVATGKPLVREVSAKKDADALVSDGAKSGSIRLSYGEDSATMISYPTAEVTQTGRPADLGTRLGLGIDPFMGATPAQRSAELTARFGIRAKKEDVEAWFAANPQPPISPAKISDLIARLADSGWDAVHASCKESGTRLKGRWEQVTGKRYGSKIATEWCPEILFPDEAYDLDVERELQDALIARANELIAKGAGRSDRIAQWGEVAARLPALTAALAEKLSVIEALDKSAEANAAERRKHIDHADAHNALACPKCNARLRLTPIATDARGKLELLPSPTGDEIAEARRKIEQIDERQSVVLAEARTARRDQITLQSEVDAAQRAADALANIEQEAESADTLNAELATIQTKTVAQRQKIDAIEALAKANAIQAEIVEVALLASSVSPDKGIRPLVLKRGLDAINASLAEISTMAAFKDVAIVNEAMVVTYGGRFYSLLSESEKWRVNIVFAVLLHEKEASASPLLIDRLDILHPPARPGVLRMLKTRGVTTVIGYTAKDAEAVPNLGKLGFGTSVWLEDGKVQAI